jgi:3-deoxy-manno-octulosonate cytidylyltransferase (CMP-KDO synthetase)
MNFFGIIPSRFASTRLPGKPLLLIEKKSMIERVFLQAEKCKRLKTCVIATDHQKIVDEVKRFNGTAVLTSESHTTGTERCLEASEILKVAKEDVVINIQGDEPFIDPENIEKLIEVFKTNADAQIATLVCKVKNEDDLFNPNCPKVLIDKQGKAIYFSRNTIPYVRDFTKEQWLQQHVFYKHIGIYAYKKEVLDNIVKLPPSTWEKSESLEQLRWLQNGYAVYVAEVKESGIAVDTEDDLNRAIEYAKANDL